jgi:hypothetical protein
MPPWLSKFILKETFSVCVTLVSGQNEDWLHDYFP